MVNLKVKRQLKKNDETPTPPDDSWWAAVLAEEESRGGGVYKPHVHGASTEGKPPSRPVQINWKLAKDLYSRDETVCLKVTGYNRGGLLVEGKGLQGFVPISHLVELTADKPSSSEPSQDYSMTLATFTGRQLALKVIECDPERGRIVLSERAAQAAPGRRNQLLDELIPGDCVSGTVTNVTDFGVFVDLGGVEGLIHVSELSWGRVQHPSTVVCLGQEVRAHVINIDKDRNRVALSLKRLSPNPWDTAESRYHPGQILEAVITSIVQFGAFARLEEGLDGLIHISEMNSNKLGLQALLREGQHVRVRVLSVEASRQRLGLSLCEPEETIAS
jgi:small subunit ribosomal protein S1